MDQVQELMTPDSEADYLITRQPMPASLSYRSSLAKLHRACDLPPPIRTRGQAITSGEGQVVGRGYTQQAGGPTPEAALRNAADLGHWSLAPLPMSAWALLSPRAHGPRCDALIDAGIKGCRIHCRRTQGFLGKVLNVYVPQVLMW
jgi:diaminohydroxyphosphoribosylaminopyrimidine deaminase/5-amino-6-(5-phosphoribosylamino)uracil reductase